MPNFNGKPYESLEELVSAITKDFKRRYKKNLATCNKYVKERKGIYGATLWTGCSGLPSFLSFDLNEVVAYLVSNTNWKTHPDLARVEFINFGKCPRQEIVGYLYSDHIKDGYIEVY